MGLGKERIVTYSAVIRIVIAAGIGLGSLLAFVYNNHIREVEITTAVLRREIDALERGALLMDKQLDDSLQRLDKRIAAETAFVRAVVIRWLDDLSYERLESHPGKLYSEE